MLLAEAAPLPAVCVAPPLFYVKRDDFVLCVWRSAITHQQREARCEPAKAMRA